MTFHQANCDVTYSKAQCHMDGCEMISIFGECVFIISMDLNFDLRQFKNLILFAFFQELCDFWGKIHNDVEKYGKFV